MVLEYAEGGTIYDKNKFGYGKLPKEKVKKYFKDVCKAVDYLHTLNYMHRDIKVPYPIQSHKIFCLQKTIMQNYAISALQL
mgnify:CR=1 FL=1